MKRLIAILLILPLTTLANFGSSNSSAASQITLTVSQKSDSARASFYYPDMSTRIDSFKMVPIAVESGVNDSTLLRATIPADALTSIGTYVVKMAVWYKGAGSISDYVLGAWEYSEIVDTTNVTLDAVQIPNDFKANVSALALEASLFDPVSDSIMVDVSTANSAGGLLASGADSNWVADTTGFTAGGSQGYANTHGGAAGGLDTLSTTEKAALIDLVWNELQSGHTTAGTFGKYLDTEISGIAGLSGTGAYTYYWVLIDSTGGADTVLPQTFIYVNNQAQSATPYQARTNNNGRATFNLDAGNYVAFTTHPAMVAVVDSFTVSAATTDTLYVYTDSTTFTTVAFDLRSIIGSGFLAQAKVKIKIEAVNDSLLYIGNQLYSSYEIPQLTANSSGMVNIKLFPNASFTNDSTYYTAWIRDNRGRRRESFKFRVPDATLIYIQDCVRWK